MNDYWNDPPENEVPECPDCGIPYDITQDEKDKKVFHLKCAECGKTEMVRQEDEIPLDDVPFENFSEPVPIPPKCPHGNEWHECNDCMIASDFAYDAAREKR